jgi:ribonuclease E
VAKEMLINISQGEECRIALVEDGKLEELYMERSSSTSHVGNIYKGRVTNVEPSIQAAFVDFGLSRNGFLHISDLMPSYFGEGADVQETVGRKMARRDRPPIQRCLRRGDEIVVQIIKEGIGTKGPTLTTYLSIPGRILVMMPGMGKMGVSRKIEDDDERRRLRHILDSLKPPPDVGFIIRTAGIGKTKVEIQRDLTYLTRVWTTFVKKRDSGPGPMELYTEGDLVTRTVRDVFTSDIDRIVVDDKEVARRIKEVIKLANPRTRNRVELYEGPPPLFHKYGIEMEIEQMYSRHVPLPSGGSLVIDSTEAIVAIDVNSGKFRDHADAETTAFKTDLEAADEIPRQLRLRDLGGVIICDFIDLRFERHRRELEERLCENFRKDRAKTKVLRMSQFGIIELTRQRMRPSLKRSIYFDCPHCKGTGLVKTPESMSLDVMRRLAIAISQERVTRVELTVSPDVEFHLQNRNRAQIAALENQFDKRVILRSDTTVTLDEVRLDLFDAREGPVYLPELGMSPPVGPHGGHGRRDGGRPGQSRGRDDRGRRDERRGPPPRPAPRPVEPFEDEDELESDEREPIADQAEAEGELATAEPGQIEPPLQSSEPGAAGFDDGQGGRRRRRRRRGRRGRGGGGGPRPPLPATDMGVQPQEQTASGYVEEYDVEQADISESQAPPDSAEPIDAMAGTTEQAPRRRRRRGRRGGRGRGGGGGQGAAGTAQISPSVPMDQPVIPAQPPIDEPMGRTGQEGGRRRRRGGRGRRRSGGNTASIAVNTPQTPARDDQPRAAEAPTVLPTGSADRHLVRDEPVAPQPVSRPRSSRDLDSIPDDFD